MRSRTILMLLFAAIVAVFVALNWTELARTSPLNLGMTQAQGPLGLIMLGLLLLAAIVFLAYAIAIQAASLMESRAHTKELNAQRELANSAEASRFTELRSLVEKIETDSRQRQTDTQQWFEQRLATLQQEVSSKVENSGNTLAAFMGELEDRVQRHLGLPPEEPLQSSVATAASAPVVVSSSSDAQVQAGATVPAPRQSGVASITSMAKRFFAGDKAAAASGSAAPLPADNDSTRQEPTLPPSAS